MQERLLPEGKVQCENPALFMECKSTESFGGWEADGGGDGDVCDDVPSFSNHSLSAYYVSGPVLSAADKMLSKIRCVLYSHGTQS